MRINVNSASSGDSVYSDSPGLATAPDSRRIPAQAGRLSLLERLPKWAICVPLVLQWLWLGLRHGGLTLPSSANPFITAGGLVGEGKLEYFAIMGDWARAHTAPYCAVHVTADIAGNSPVRGVAPDHGHGHDHDHHSHGFATSQSAMQQSDFAFPVVAKPDLGLCGYGVQRLENSAALQAYLQAFPRNETVVLQPYLPQAGEAGIFYARDPASERGRIIGLALRHFPQVTGDGRRTLHALTVADPRARRMLRAHAQLPANRNLDSSLDTKSCSDWQCVPASGEVVRLATVGSTRVGGLYRNGGAHITPALVQAIDRIARDMREFHFGRFDVRFESLQALRAGHGFIIMEVNGAGSEAIEAWDPDISLLAGLRMIFAKQRLLFAIGAAMRKRGHAAIGWRELARLNRRQQRLIAAYPPSN